MHRLTAHRFYVTCRCETKRKTAQSGPNRRHIRLGCFVGKSSMHSLLLLVYMKSNLFLSSTVSFFFIFQFFPMVFYRLLERVLRYGIQAPRAGLSHSTTTEKSQIATSAKNYFSARKNTNRNYQHTEPSPSPSCTQSQISNSE